MVAKRIGTVPPIAGSLFEIPMIHDTQKAPTVRQDTLLYRTMVTLQRLRLAYQGLRQRTDLDDLIGKIAAKLKRNHSPDFAAKFLPVPWHPAAGDPVWIDDDPEQTGHVLNEADNGYWSVRIPTDAQGHHNITDIEGRRLRLAGADHPRPTSNG